MGLAKGSQVKGVILILVGVTLLLLHCDILDISRVWPGAVILTGVILLMLAIRDRRPGVSVPGTTLIALGMFFMYETFNYWDDIDSLWPVFIISPGLGFIVAYFLEKVR